MLSEPVAAEPGARRGARDCRTAARRGSARMRTEHRPPASPRWPSSKPPVRGCASISC
ncbi:MAG: hypothetical protein KL801_00785 [Mesorhizobium sp.]|nr:hypothetical protein [Mesorhizobium sp.]